MYKQIVLAKFYILDCDSDETNMALKGSAFLTRFFVSLIGLTIASHIFAPTSHAFEYFEHRWIGNVAYQEARGIMEKEGFNDFIKVLDHTSAELFNVIPICKKVPCGEEHDFIKYIRKIPIEFGDLSALAGDHAETPDKLLDFLDNKTREAARFIATRRQWENVCTWLYQSNNNISSINATNSKNVNTCYKDLLRGTTKLLGEEFNLAETIYLRSQGYTPPRLELAEFEKLKYFTSLVANNRMHFPRHSWSEYRKYHRAALTSALFSAEKNKGVKVPRPIAHDESSHSHLADALILEGFAQHFLQDSFASGHIGASSGSADLFRGWESKQQFQHTHDTLNKVGIEVYFPLSLSFSSWIAFGDQHLFIPEASTHRSIVLSVAMRSIFEVLGVAAGRQNDELCRMCSDDIFPIPKNLSLLAGNVQAKLKDFSSTGSLAGSIFGSDYETRDLADWDKRDSRVPPLSLEGWKVLATWGVATGPYQDGGSTFDLKNSFQFGKPKKQFQASTITIELGYVRNTDPRFPNYVGVGFLTTPSAGRTSIYPISVGYWGNPIPGSKLSMGIRANVGLRINEPNTERNPYTSRLVGGELSIPVDIMYDIYPPIALYVRYELFSLYSRGLGDDPVRPSVKIDSLFGNGAIALSVGGRFDLAGIL